MKNQGIITSIQDVKLPLSVKIGYSIGNVAKALLAVSTAAFLLFFYTDVCGINPKIASTIILIAKIWDIINDPMMGAIVDKTVSKEGKCRFYLKYFSVPAGIIFALTFFMPNFAMPGKVAWAVVTYILQGMFSTVLLIPMNTLMGRITSNQQQRVHLNQFANIFSLAGSMAVTGFTMRIVMAVDPTNMVKGFTVVGIVFAVIYVLCHLIVFWTTKGYEPLEHLAGEQVAAADKSAPKVQASLSARLAALMKNKMWLAIIVMFLLVNMSLSLENAAMAFYFQYNHGSNMQTLYSLYSTVGLVVPIIFIVLLNQFTRVLGIAKTSLLGSVVCLISYVLRYVLHDGSTLVMGIGWALYQFGGALITCTVLLLVFESRDYGLRKTGVDNEAILMSGFSVSYKIGMAIGGAIIGYIMPSSYVAQAATQTQEVQDFFFHCSTLFPAVSYVICTIAGIYIWKYEAELTKGKAAEQIVTQA